MQPVLFVVVVVAVWLTPAGAGLRGRLEPSTWRAVREPRPVPRELARLPEVRVTGVALVAAIVVALALVPVVFTESRTNLAAVALVYGVIALSLVVLTGWAGEISLGQMAFVAVGAAVGASITARLGWDLAFGLLGAGARRRRGGDAHRAPRAPAARAHPRRRHPRLRVGHHRVAAEPPHLRRGDPLRLVAAAAASNDRICSAIIPVQSEGGFYRLCLVALALVVIAVVGIRRSRTGRVLIAIRENERAATTFGVNARATTLGAFAISGFLAAFAGALFVHQQNGLQLDSYTAGESLVVFTMVVIGGLGSVPGALLGALFVRGVTWWLPVEWQILATGVGMLVVLLVFRGGLGAAFADLRDRFLRRVARRRGLSVPALTGVTREVVRDDAAPPSRISPAADGRPRRAPRPRSRR